MSRGKLRKLLRSPRKGYANYINNKKEKTSFKEEFKKAMEQQQNKEKQDDNS